VEAWVLNDLPEAPAGAQLAWWVEWAGRAVFSQRAPAEIRPSGAAYQGEIAWVTPEVAARTPFTVGLALVAADGQTIHQHRLEMEVFPRLHWPSQGQVAAILGQSGGRAWNFALQAGMQPVPFLEAGRASLALADSPAAVEATGPALAKWLAAGGSLLSLEQAAGEGAWRIAGREVRWKPFDPAFFACRKTGHPAARVLGEFDLAYWHHPGLERIEPTFHSVLEGERLQAIAFTTAPIPPGTTLRLPERHPVAAELSIGRGRVLFSEVDALSRFPAEPLAGVYLQGLVEYLFSYWDQQGE
jgi:hypothetical protein